MGGGEGGEGGEGEVKDIAVLVSLQEKLNDATIELESLRVETRTLRDELKSEKLKKIQLLAILKAKQDERFEYRADGSLSRQNSSGRASRTPQNSDDLLPLHGPPGGAGPGYANSDSGVGVGGHGGAKENFEEEGAASANMLKFKDRMRSEIDYHNNQLGSKKMQGGKSSKKKQKKATGAGEKGVWGKMQQEIDHLRTNLGARNATPEFDANSVGSPKKAWGRSSLFGATADPEPPTFTSQMAWTNSAPGDEQFKLSGSKNTSHHSPHRNVLGQSNGGYGRSSLGQSSSYGRSSQGQNNSYGRSSLDYGQSKKPMMSREIDQTQFDRGSLIYILGNSSSSVWAKKIMSDLEKGNRRLKNIDRARSGLAV